MIPKRGNSVYKDTLNILEADIQQANALAAALPKGRRGALLQLALVPNQWAPIFLFLLRWLDCSCLFLLPRYLNLFDIHVHMVCFVRLRCHYIIAKNKSNVAAFMQACAERGRRLTTHKRKATIREFYGVILPSLRQLHSIYKGQEDGEEERLCRKSFGERAEVVLEEGHKACARTDPEREEECGICLESCSKMVLPHCCHAICMNCYRNWYTRSESCPFCRSDLKRVKLRDLWVLMHQNEVADMKLVRTRDLLRFYFYLNNLPEVCPDTVFLLYYGYLL